MTGLGIIRPARRPPGWAAPGPAPAGPSERADSWPAMGEDLCYLTGDWRIFQRLDGHRWSLDDLVTAWYAVAHLGELRVRRHLDLGCGIGSVLLMIAWSLPDVRCVGIEAQSMSVDLARRSLAYNGAQDRCRIVHGDLRHPSTLEDEGTFELVTGTPPYFDPAAGTVSDRAQRGPCRFETRGGIEAYATAAGRHLSTDGRFVACETAGQRERVETACARAGLFLQRWRDVVPREGKAPLLSVFVAGRSPARAIHESPLVVRDADLARTEQFVAVRARMGMPP